MKTPSNIPDHAVSNLRWPVRLTRMGMFAENVTRSFWPFATVLMLLLAALMFGFHETMKLELVWGLGVVAVVGLITSLFYGIRKIEWPSSSAARDRLDATMPGRPIAALTDNQAIGSGDKASEAVWKAHIARMADKTADARAVEPDLKISDRDPYALRYVGVLAIAMALIFGSILRVTTVTDVVTAGNEYSTGPTWEGWIEPPSYTGKPSLYLSDLASDGISVPQDSIVTLRLYGEVGDLTVAETVSGRVGEVTSAVDANQEFSVTQSGTLSIDGNGGQSWVLNVIADLPPTIAADDAPERGVDGDMKLPFSAKDDYGVLSATVEIELDLDAVDRSYGLALEPQPQDTIVLDLPMPLGANRTDFSEVLIENLAQHPWATLPAKITFKAIDAAGQVGTSLPETFTLPGRRFFDPLAAALVEQRRDLLWNRENADRVANVLRSVSYQPEDLFQSHTAYLKLRVAIRRLSVGLEHDSLSAEIQQEIADVLWDIAVLIEDGNLSDALERLRRAQERLSEAMEQGATDDEIAQLMDELREAMQDYMRQLAEQSQQDQNQTAENQNTQEITGDQLQEMLNRLQELMEQGRMDEAQQLLDQLRQMMENMQVTQGQQGQGQQSPGQQAMEGLAETLRQQQGLNDETFSDLQQQFDQQGQQGEQGQQGQQGQQGEGQQGQGGQQGQQGQNGQGSQGQQPGQGQGQGNQPGQGLAERQQALRDMLNQQRQNLPGSGAGGDAAGEALDRAGRAMEGAEDALRDEDFAGALDDQAEAMEALREGMRELAEEMAQQQQNQPGQQGEAFGRNNSEANRDPLGRSAGSNGQIGTDEQLLQGDDVYRRARELLDEIRRKSSEQDRPDIELDYLKRLLDRF